MSMQKAEQERGQQSAKPPPKLRMVRDHSADIRMLSD